MVSTSGTEEDGPGSRLEDCKSVKLRFQFERHGCRRPTNLSAASKSRAASVEERRAEESRAEETRREQRRREKGRVGRERQAHTRNTTGIVSFQVRVRVVGSWRSSLYPVTPIVLYPMDSRSIGPTSRASTRIRGHNYVLYCTVLCVCPCPPPSDPQPFIII